jgi:hypothetical protein
MKKIVSIKATGEGADLFASHLFVYEIGYEDGSKSDMITDIDSINVVANLAGVRVQSIADQDGGLG